MQTVKFAPIAPLGLYKELKATGNLGTFHLLLAHEVEQAPDEYAELFKDRPEEHIILMDNGTVELGAPVSPNVMEDAVRAVAPNVIILPDVIGDMEATIKIVKKFAKQYKELRDTYNCELMGVIQGKTQTQLIECADEIDKATKCDAFGIPRWITKEMGSRMGITMNIQFAFTSKQIHLLGFSNNLIDDISCARIPGIRGIDSSLPVVLGDKAQLISLDSEAERAYRGPVWKSIKMNRHILTNIRRVRRWIGETNA